MFCSTSLNVNEFNRFNDLCQTASVNDVKAELTENDIRPIVRNATEK